MNALFVKSPLLVCEVEMSKGYSGVTAVGRSRAPKGVHVYSEVNDISPRAMPGELCGYGKLTFMEAMILALVHPVIRVYKVRGYGQFKGGKVHLINFPQNPQKSFT